MTETGQPPIRIAHVIETLGTGGAEVLLAEVTRRLDRARFRSRVFVLEAPLYLEPRFNAAGVEVEALRIPPRRRPLRCLVALTRALRRFAPDVVHTHLYYANVFGRIAARFAGGAPVVTTLHNPDYTFESRGTAIFTFKKALDRFTGRRNAALLAVSEAVAEDYRRHMGWNVRLIRNGVDTEWFAPISPSGVGSSGAPGHLKVLSIGRLHPQKGHATLLEAVALCRDRGLTVDLTVAGEGPLREDLVARARQLGIDGHVRWLGRAEDVRELLRATEVFAFPSLYEAVGLALLEAMACGVPVVASRAGGIPEVVTDGVSGLLVAPAEAEPLAEAMMRLAGDPGLRRTLGRSARDRAQAFDIGGQVRELEDMYLEFARP